MSKYSNWPISEAFSDLDLRVADLESLVTPLENRYPHTEKVSKACGIKLKFNDPIHNPQHYTQGIECWDYVSSHKMDFLQGNVVKYVTRFRHKNGLEDLYKARAYLDKLISEEKGIGENGSDQEKSGTNALHCAAESVREHHGTETSSASPHTEVRGKKP